MTELSRGPAALNRDYTPLIYLTDADVIWVIEQWSILHPKREDGHLGLDSSDVSHIQRIHEWRQLNGKIVHAISERLDIRKLAELEVMFYRERDGQWSKNYNEMLAAKIQYHSAVDDRIGAIHRLLEKTSLLQYVQGSALRLGEIALAKSLSDLALAYNAARVSNP